MRSILVCYCLGILVVTASSALELLAAHAQAACVIAAALVYFSRTMQLQRSLPLAILALSAGAVLHCHWALNHLEAQLDESLEGRELRVRGRVATMAKATATALQFEFVVLEASLLAEQGGNRRLASPVRFAGRVLLSYYPQARSREAAPLAYAGALFPSALEPGSELQLVVKLNKPHGFSNPGGFDYEAFLFRRAIAAKGYVRGELDNVTGSDALPRPTPWGALLVRAEALRFQLRGRILNNHAQAHAAPADGIAMILALGLGDASAISDRLWQLLRDTGTVHLFVVSGLHVALFAFLMLLPATLVWHLLVSIAPGFGRRVSRRRWVASWSFLAAFGYALLAGWGLPIRRAVVMLAVVAIGVCWRRRYGGITGLLVALAIVLTLCPLAATASGFWLSFAAVGVLMLTSSGSVVVASGIGVRLQRLLWPQLAIGVGLSLPLLLFGGRVALLAPLINLVAIPLLSVALLPCVLLALLAVFMGIGAPAALHIASVLGELLVVLLAGVAGFGEPWQPRVAPSGLDGAALALATALLLFPLAWATRFWIGGWLLLCSLLANMPAGSGLSPHGDASCRQRPSSLRVDLLDVGQGLSALIRTRCHALLVDTGARLGPEFEMGGAVIAPALRALGVARLDKLILSHADNDHAGGAVGVLAVLPVTQLLIGGERDEYVELEDALDIPTRSCRAGQSWRWDGAVFEILGPVPEEAPRSRNARSCLLRVSFAGRAVLLPGDIERKAELALVSRRPRSLSASVLIAPHHGSRSSSSFALLKRVQPQWVLVPAGYMNAFGHPHSMILARYKLAGAATVTTATGGMLSLAIDAGGRIDGVREYRETEPRYWRPRPRVL